MMNNKYKEIWDAIISNDKITILSHTNADGDTIGSATALKHLILENSNIKDVKISGEKAPRFVSFIDEGEEVDDEFFDASQVIVVDATRETKIFDTRVISTEAIKIDHHIPEGQWKMEIAGDNWPATGQILYEMAVELNLKISSRAAEAMWVAIWTDTYGLKLRNPSETTIKAIKELDVNQEGLLSLLELTNEEKEHIERLRQQLVVKDNVCSLVVDDVVPNDYLRIMIDDFSMGEGFEVLCVVVKVEEDLYRGEMKSKGKVNVSEFSKKFSGTTSHFSSAGFKCKSLEEVRKNIAYIKSQIQ